MMRRWLMAEIDDDGERAPRLRRIVRRSALILWILLGLMGLALTFVLAAT